MNRFSNLLAFMALSSAIFFMGYEAQIAAGDTSQSALLVPSDNSEIPARPEAAITLENDNFSLGIDPGSGAILSLVIKRINCDMIGEKRLQANFRICLPLEDYQANYIEGMEQRPVAVSKSGNVVTVHFKGMRSPQGEFPLDLSYTITLDGDQVRFRSKLTNHSKEPVSEFWFPRLGGWTNFGNDRNSVVTVPEYGNCSHLSLFNGFPGNRSFGTEAAEWSVSYPLLQMPWLDIYSGQSNTGLYLGYHDDIYRLSTWHFNLYPTVSGRFPAWLTPEQVNGDPVGLIFSHVRYPFIQNGETLDSGDFIIRVHPDDWHTGSLFYRKWFTDRWPIDKSDRWLRKKSAWFSSIIYQPEDKIIADYNLYDQWCREAFDQAGIDCYELIGWDSGGLERNYPDYTPEEKLGGKDGFIKLLKDIDSSGGRCLVFVNYNVLDQNTDWYRSELYRYTHQDQFGKTPNWMGWGESTLIARTQLSVRRHVLSSVVPPMEKILEDHFLQIARDGAHGLQIDKLCVGSALDFNPLNQFKPDVALCEGLVQSVARVWQKCRQIDPDFCFASECSGDRFIPYIDVYYRSAGGTNISPLRYVFPEWTSAIHIGGGLFEFNGINGAVLTGAVICVEPQFYQGSLGHPHYRELARYLKEVERIRRELADIIFLGKYYDNLYATINLSGGGMPADLVYKTHGHYQTDRRAIVVANLSGQPYQYQWQFGHRDVQKAQLYTPFEPVREVLKGTPLEIKPEGLHILVESED